MAAQAIADCFSYKPVPVEGVDRVSYYIGVVTALRLVLDMPRELYDAACAGEAQVEEPEAAPRDNIFATAATASTGASNGES